MGKQLYIPKLQTEWNVQTFWMPVQWVGCTRAGYLGTPSAPHPTAPLADSGSTARPTSATTSLSLCLPLSLVTHTTTWLLLPDAHRTPDAAYCSMVDYLNSSVASSASSVRSWTSSSSSSTALPTATKSSRTSSSRSSTSSSSSSSGGKSHAHRHGGLSCSTLQHEWQTTHPVYLAIQNGDTVNNYLSNLRLDRQLHHLLGDLSELVPPSASMPSLHKNEPNVKDYVQLPCHIWAPDYFYPHLVPCMPCSTPDCKGRATRQRWNPNGPTTGAWRPLCHIRTLLAVQV